MARGILRALVVVVMVYEREWTTEPSARVIWSLWNFYCVVIYAGFAGFHFHDSELRDIDCHAIKKLNQLFALLPISKYFHSSHFIWLNLYARLWCLVSFFLKKNVQLRISWQTEARIYYFKNHQLVLKQSTPGNTWGVSCSRLSSSWLSRLERLRHVWLQREE